MMIRRQHSHPLLFLALALCQSDLGHTFVPSPSSLVVSKRNRHSFSPRRDIRAHHASPWTARNKRQLTVNYFFFKDEEGESETPQNNNNNNSNEQKQSNSNTIIPTSDQTSFAKYGRPQDITSESFGPLLPIAEAVDEATGGWGLSYADLHPATPQTTIGQAFLATNFFYAAAGLWLGFKGDWFYGGLTELAGIVSFVYHYTQLEFGKNRSEVRLALLIDYFTAGSALITGGVYMIQAGISSVPVDALLAAGASTVCLSLCWVWEFGYPYIFWHSLWHVLSAYTGFL
ncbi:hypothetical protein ACHAXR_001359, partial [Thalassiosira sp. AJA248-18]